MTLPGERPEIPTADDLIHGIVDSWLDGLHTATPGRVLAYDAATQTADVQPGVPGVVQQPDGTVTFEPMPALASVPVLFPRSGPWFVAMKVAQGDTGLLISCESDIGPWRAGNGGDREPGDLRRHHLAHAVFLPGFTVRSGKLAHAPSDGMAIGSDAANGPRLTIAGDGVVTLSQGATVVLKVDASGVVHLGAAAGAAFVALASKVDEGLATIRAWANTHTHPVSGAVATVTNTPLAALGPTAATKAKAT